LARLRGRLWRWFWRQSEGFRVSSHLFGDPRTFVADLRGLHIGDAGAVMGAKSKFVGCHRARWIEWVHHSGSTGG
jgi:hypothetical protein